MMPTVTKNLIIINVLVFFGTIVAQRYGLDLTNYLGLHFFLASDFNPAQLITYMFMHGGFSHIFFNMFAVFMFGPILEQTWGPKRFLFYYILCGIGAGLIQEGVQYIQYVTELSHYAQVNIGTGVIPMEVSEDTGEKYQETETGTSSALSESMPASSQPSLRVLLIDDDRIQLTLTAAMLQHSGIASVSCMQLDELLDALRSDTFDVPPR